MAAAFGTPSAHTAPGSTLTHLGFGSGSAWPPLWGTPPCYHPPPLPPRALPAPGVALHPFSPPSPSLALPDPHGLPSSSDSDSSRGSSSHTSGDGATDASTSSPSPNPPPPRRRARPRPLRRAAPSALTPPTSLAQPSPPPPAPPALPPSPPRRPATPPPRGGFPPSEGQPPTDPAPSVFPGGGATASPVPPDGGAAAPPAPATRPPRHRPPEPSRFAAELGRGLDPAHRPRSDHATRLRVRAASLPLALRQAVQVLLDLLEYAPALPDTRALRHRVMRAEAMVRAIIAAGDGDAGRLRPRPLRAIASHFRRSTMGSKEARPLRPSDRWSARPDAVLPLLGGVPSPPRTPASRLRDIDGRVVPSSSAPPPPQWSGATRTRFSDSVAARPLPPRTARARGGPSGDRTAPSPPLPRHASGAVSALVRERSRWRSASKAGPFSGPRPNYDDAVPALAAYAAFDEVAAAPRAAPEDDGPAPLHAAPSAAGWGSSARPLKPIVRAGTVDHRRVWAECRGRADDPERLRQALRYLHDPAAHFEGLELPPPAERPRPRASAAITREDDYLLQRWGVWEVAPRHAANRVYGTAFKRPKRDPAWARLVIDDGLNPYEPRPPTFRTHSPRDIVTMAHRLPYGASFDYTNQFYLLPTPPEARPLHTVRLRGGGVRQFRVLVMGNRRVPQVAQVITCAVAGAPVTDIDPDRDNAMVILDNTTLLDASLQALTPRARDFEARSDRCGLLVGDKTDLAATGGTEFVHSGIRLVTTDSVAGRGYTRWRTRDGWAPAASLTIERFRHDGRGHTFREWLAIGGLILWYLRVLDIPLLAISPLLEWAGARQRLVTSGALDQDARSHTGGPPEKALRCVQSVADLMRLDPWAVRLPGLPPGPCVWTDAAGWGRGVVIPADRTWYGVPWPRGREPAAGNMPAAEAEANVRAIEGELSAGLRGVLFRTVVDCEPWYRAVVAGRSHSYTLDYWLRRLYKALWRAECRLMIGWTPTDAMLADRPSRGRGAPLSWGERVSMWARHPVPLTGAAPGSHADEALLFGPAPPFAGA